MMMAVIEVLNKLQHLPAKSWALAGLIGTIQLVSHDAFFWMWTILLFTNLVDWVAGRCSIRLTNPRSFSRRKSREGLYSKALGLTVLALLRSMEAVLPALLPAAVPGTNGFLASIVGIALFIDELDSIDRHRQVLGRKPIPMLSWAIDKLRAATGAERRTDVVSGPQNGDPEKRATHRQ